MKIKTKTPEQIAAVFGCTVASLKRQYKDNADTLKTMAERAEKTGKKVGYLTASELRERETKMRLLSY